MTQEDKLEFAKQWYNDPTTTAKEKLFLEQIFPELCESDDEQIIKSIIGYLKECRNNTRSEVMLDEYAKWIACLEKQGEQKSSWSEDDIVAIDCAVEVLSKDLPSLAASIERLKSLKPQKQWKPSEKQMQALESSYSVLKTHDTWAEDEHLPLLLSLCNDLKKLYYDMTGIEYMNTVCPTTSAGREPNREDVADAFEDGIAEGHKQHWKPSEEQIEALRVYLYHPQYINNSEDIRIKLVESLYNDLKKLLE